MPELVRTAHFNRQLRQFIRQHPDLVPRLGRLFEDLAADPFMPTHGLHRLRGELEGLHAVSVTYSYRVILTLRLTANEIVLHDIGTHEEVYG